MLAFPFLPETEVTRRRNKSPAGPTSVNGALLETSCLPFEWAMALLQFNVSSGVNEILLPSIPPERDVGGRNEWSES